MIIRKKDNKYIKEVYVNYDNAKKLLDGKYILINKTKYKYKIIQKENIIDNENLLNYKLFNININLNKKYLQNNLVLDIKIFSNKERMIKKIKNLFN